jgi:hypothetical protein
VSSVSGVGDLLVLDDGFAASLALGAPEPLRSFNGIGVLSAADVHVAMTLAELAGGGDVTVQLAVALAVRAPRLGHVFVAPRDGARHRRGRIGRDRRPTLAAVARG